MIVTLLWMHAAQSVQADTPDTSNAIKPLPLEAYGSLPDISNVRMSPDGSHLAMLKNIGGLQVLMAVDLAKGTSKPLLKTDGFKTLLTWYQWANNDTLIYGASYPSSDMGVKYTIRRLYRYNVRSDDEPRLAIKPRLTERSAQFQDGVISLMPTEPDEILVETDFDSPGFPSVYRVNLKTGKRDRVERRRVGTIGF